MRPVTASDRIIDFIVVLCIIFFCETIVAFRDELPKNSVAENRLTLLGAQYDSIARAIRRGRGFSDPFEVSSGPTAWMPPALPVVISGLYALFDDDRASVIKFVILLQGLSIFVTGAIVTSTARRLGIPLAGYFAFLIGCIVNFFWFFQRTHDVWFLLFAFNLLWVGIQRGWVCCQNLKSAASWGILGGSLALCSPVAVFVWFAMTVLVNALDGGTRYRRCTISLLIALMFASPWMIRNYVVFNKFIPIKSNLAFELWQAQCLDNDGVLDDRTLSQHPWSVGGAQAKKEYLRDGEAKFMESRWDSFSQSLVDDPQRFFERVVNRFFACFFIYESTYSSHSSLLITKLTRTLFFLPTVCGVLILLLHSHKSRTPILCAALYFIALSPYILISYYPRYSAPLAGIQMLLMVYGIELLRHNRVVQKLCKTKIAALV